MDSKPSFYSQVWDECKFHQPGQRILPAENRLDMNAPQRSQIRSPVLSASQNLSYIGWQISNQSNPPDADLGFARLYRLSNLIGKQHGGEVHACPLTQRVVAPGTGVKVQ